MIEEDFTGSHPHACRDITDIWENSLEDGVERISSNDLSKRMKLTASQIRQDLEQLSADSDSRDTAIMSNIYHTEIGKILGLEERS